MKSGQTSQLCDRLFFLSQDHNLKNRVKNWNRENSKKIILGKHRYPDMIAKPFFAIIADPVFVGNENMIWFIEFQKSIGFDDSIYEDEEQVNFYKECFDLDENGKFIQETTELILTNELNADEIISRLDCLVN